MPSVAIGSGCSLEISGAHQALDLMMKVPARTGVPGESLQPLLVLDEVFQNGKLIRPMGYELLWHDFAMLESGAASILKFARKWGPLGSPLLRDHSVIATSRDFVTKLAEPISEWIEQIKSAKLFVEVRSLTADGDIDELRKHFTFSPSSASGRGQPSTVMAKTELSERFLMQFTKRSFPLKGRQVMIRPSTDMIEQQELLLAAMVLCGWMATLKLRELQLQPNLIFSDSDRSYSVQLSPTSLIACIWLQLSRLLIGDLNYRLCKYCGKPIRLGTTGVRADATYCPGGSCRTQASRKRVKGHRD